MKSNPITLHDDGGPVMARRTAGDSPRRNQTHAMWGHRRVAALFLGACSVLAACASDPVDPVDPVTEEVALVITSKTPTLIEGTLADPGAPLSFQSIERAPRSVDVMIRVGDTEMVLRTDSARGEATFDARSGQLSPAQHSTLEGFMAALVERFGHEESAPTNSEVALRNALNYIIALPVSTTLRTVTAVAETSVVYLPCNCSWNYIGNGWSAQTGKGEQCGSSGAPHCPGRCGIGCGPDNLKYPWAWGSGRYTRDCALHDYGLGSIEAALDDYAMTFANCG